MPHSNASHARTNRPGGAPAVPDGGADPAAAPPSAAAAPPAAAPSVAPPPAATPSVPGPSAATPSASDDPPASADAADVARALALCAIEIIAGARELETIARWITDDVQRHLQRRIAIAARGRSVRRRAPSRPLVTAGSVRTSEPAAGVLECTVVVHGGPRVRAVAVRLELHRDDRWRATAINVL